MSYIVPREKPNRCTNCIYMDRITYDCKLMYGDDYPDFEIQYKNCPLIEIHTPHGRLVDLDKMVDEYWDGSSMRIGKTDIKDIEEYDVVIEAEGSEE